MKKIVLTCILGLYGIAGYAQFATYHNIYEEEEIQQTPAQTVYGYVPTSKGWVRVTIRIKQVGNSVKVVGYKEKNTSRFAGAYATYGTSNPWRNCNTWADEVSVISDGKEVANNFDYKASITGLGTVYF